MSTNKNAATSAKVTALRTHAEKERTVHNEFTTGGLIDAVEHLISVAEDANPFVVYRHGLRFELSGSSVAVYDATLPWPEGPYTEQSAAEAQSRLLNRFDVSEASVECFHAAIDAYELRRYLEVA